MENIGRYLAEQAETCKIAVSPEQAGQFQTYAELLVEWNRKMNLTAITEPKEIAVKHFLDSILLLKAVEIPRGSSLIDVGTGAGFPGVALAILRPDIRLTLLDSLRKRLVFLKDLLEHLNLTAELLHSRAEEAGRKKEYRGKFDFASARAVARLPVLCEYCLPFLKSGGVFAAMKGPGGEGELKDAQKAIALLGCKTEECRSYRLPGGDARTLITIRRVASLPAIYPRQSAKIARDPL